MELTQPKKPESHSARPNDLYISSHRHHSQPQQKSPAAVRKNHALVHLLYYIGLLRVTSVGSSGISLKYLGCIYLCRLYTEKKGIYSSNISSSTQQWRETQPIGQLGRAARIYTRTICLDGCLLLDSVSGLERDCQGERRLAILFSFPLFL